MNFGNIGFANVSGDTSANNSFENQTQSEQSQVVNVSQEQPINQQQNSNTQVAQTQTVNNQPIVPDLMAGVKEAQEAKALEEAQAIEDFKNTTTKKTNYEKDADNFSQIDFGPLKKYLDDDNITDISYSNNGQLWLKSLDKGVYRADQQDVDNALIEKIAFQCSNVMGKTFNMAHPFLDSESAELRMNFVHESIARNGIAVVFRKTPAKIRLEKQKLLKEKYVRLSIHDFLINCVKGHCNIIVCGETGSGKTELIKYLASHTAENEKLITIEDTLELHLDRIFPHRDIVAMKTNNIASYSDVLVTCMRQNPIWILLSEVRSAEAVTAVRNSISSGHYILSTIHADKAESIPHRMYSLLESNIDVEQFLKTIYRYVQIGVFVRGRYSATEKRFVREIAGVCEFFVTEDTNEPKFNNIYLKNVAGEEKYTEPTKYIKNYLEGQGVDINNLFGENLSSLEAANEANGINVQVDVNTKVLDDEKQNNNIEVLENASKTEIQKTTPQVKTIEQNQVVQNNMGQTSNGVQQNNALKQVTPNLQQPANVTMPTNIPQTIPQQNIQTGSIPTTTGNTFNQQNMTLHQVPQNGVNSINNVQNNMPVQPPVQSNSKFFGGIVTNNKGLGNPTDPLIN
ncbi:MAG: type II/IV secretion system ATPase subunit [Bacilli bacterium]|nr:type II/IV secretion system ATPase subunit [Bacilli bacterium]